MAKQKSKPSIHDLTRVPLSGEIGGMNGRELLKGSDRAAALVGCAMIDESLSRAIAQKMIVRDDDLLHQLFYAPNAPLSSLSSKILISRCMGITEPDEHVNLNIIRRVRNAFAHSTLPLSFNNEFVRLECAKFTKKHLKLRTGPKINPSRELYIAVCMELWMHLEYRAYSYNPWPEPWEIEDDEEPSS